jgi:hypothetical protein
MLLHSLGQEALPVAKSAVAVHLEHQVAPRFPLHGLDRLEVELDNHALARVSASQARSPSAPRIVRGRRTFEVNGSRVDRQGALAGLTFESRAPGYGVYCNRSPSP